MTQEMLIKIKDELSQESMYRLFKESVGIPEDLLEQDSTDSYALMYNFETSELFFLNYATPANSWAKTAMGQNPWVLLGYVSAIDIVMGNPTGDIIAKLEYEFEQQDSY